MKKPQYTIPLVLLAVLFGSIACMTLYKIKVTGYLDREHSSLLVPGKSVFVLQYEHANNPLLEKEVATKIEKLLEAKGYRSAPADEADFFLTFSYGMDKGALHSYTTPKYKTITTRDPNTGWASAIRVQTGSTSHSVQYHDRSLIVRVIDACKLREAQKSEVIWVGDTMSEGKSNDIRKVLDYLLVATFDHFGEDTGKAVKVTLAGSDSRVKNLSNESPR